MNATECPSISMFSGYLPLKFMFIGQISFASMAIIAVVATARRTFSSVLLDSSFKEHIICCYLIHLQQAVAMIYIMGLFLVLHLTQPLCMATIPYKLCYYSRLSYTFSVFTLPTLNMSLVVFRILTFFGEARVRGKETAIQRAITTMALLLSCLEFYWKIAGIVVPDVQVAFCRGATNNSDTETKVTCVMEVLTIGASLWLMYEYEKENRAKRSFDVSVNLTRRQLISTMRLFLPYSLFHALIYLLYTVVFFGSRYLNLLDPLLSAVGGFVFCPMYFTAFSPWIVYSIIVKNETKRIEQTNDLLNLERKARDLYFAHYRAQW